MSEQGGGMALRIAVLIFAVVTAGGSHAQAQTPPLLERTESSDRAVDTEQLAERELKIGRFSMDKHNYTGAINRFKTVVTQYPTSASAEEALARLAEAYLAIGINSEAQCAMAVLQRKFPDGQWAHEARDGLSSAGIEPAEDAKCYMSGGYR